MLPASHACQDVRSARSRALPCRRVDHPRGGRPPGRRRHRPPPGRGRPGRGRLPRHRRPSRPFDDGPRSLYEGRRRVWHRDRRHRRPDRPTRFRRRAVTSWSSGRSIRASSSRRSWSTPAGSGRAISGRRRGIVWRRPRHRRPPAKPAA